MKNLFSNAIEADQSELDNEGIERAFIKTIYFLRTKSDFISSINEILKSGGNSNLFSIIIGGILGCAYGYENLPEYMLDSIN